MTAIGLVQAFGREADEYRKFDSTVRGSIKAYYNLHWHEVLYWLFIGTTFAVGSTIDQWRVRQSGQRGRRQAGRGGARPGGHPLPLLDVCRTWRRPGAVHGGVQAVCARSQAAADVADRVVRLSQVTRRPLMSSSSHQAEADSPFAPLAERSRRFLAASQARPRPSSPRRAHQDAAFFGAYRRRPFWERYARSLADALEQEPVCLFDGELLVGLTYQGDADPLEQDPAYVARWAPYSAAAQMERRQRDEGVDPYLLGRGAPGHVGWRWDQLLAWGISGLMEQIRERLAQSPDAQAKRFYRGALILWQAVLRWNARHVAALEEKARRCGGAERERLERLAEICRRVPLHPARTFHEAVQSFHLQHLALMFENPFGGNGPGRLDYFLWPYLERDRSRRRDLLPRRFLLAAGRDLLVKALWWYTLRRYISPIPAK